MIENIYSTENTTGNQTNKNSGINTRIKSPKNVRQVGKIGNGVKIYVEDYVKTYTKQLAETDYMERCIAILIGEYRILEGEKDLFIYGAIGTSKAYSNGKIEFTEDIWTSVYEMIKQYFADGEIVGWYFGGASFGTEETKQLQVVHVDNFAGKDKVLLTYDILEKEENFYIYENGYLVLQPGYYIYYEKNEEMQNYMVDHKKVKQEELIIDDHTVKQIRSKLMEKKQPELSQREQKTVLHLVYAAGTLMTVVALLVGVTVLNNSEKMKSLENALTTISKSLSDGVDVRDNALERDNIFELDDSIPASTNQGNVIPSPEIKNEVVTPLPEVTNNPLETSTQEGEDLDSQLNSDEDTNTNADNGGTENVGDVPQVNDEEKIKDESEADNSEDLQETGGIDPSKLKVYTVKSGDTIASICRKLYGGYTNMQLIKELNQLVDENKIFIGQELLVP